MPFDQQDPSDSEKIRDLGAVIRPNWKAIEEGSDGEAQADKLKLWSVNFFSRDDIAPPPVDGNDASELTNGIVMYSKTDSDTDLPEFFVRHEDATVSQLTKGPANISPSGFAKFGETSLFGGLILKFGRVTLPLGVATTITFTDYGLTDFPNNHFGTFIQNSISPSTPVAALNLTLTSFDGYSPVAMTVNFISIGN